MASYLEHQSRNALAAVWGLLFPVSKRTVESVRLELESGKIHKILFIRPQQGIGDMMMLTAVFRALKERYPRVELHVLASPRNRKALMRNARLASVRTLSLRSLWQLRGECCDLVIPVFTHTPSWTNFAFARLGGARIVWSFDSSSFYGGNNWSRSLSHTEIPASNPKDPEWKRYAALVEPLIGPLHEARTEYAVSSSDKAWANQRWDQLGLQGPAPVVGLFVGGNPDHPGRFVPVDTWLSLVERFEKEGARIVLIHPPHEPFLYKELSARLSHPVPVVDEYDLGHVLAFMQRLTLLVCPDGGTFHLAAGAGVQTVGLFTSTDPVRWCPPGKHVRTLALADANLIRLPNLLSSSRLPTSSPRRS